MTAIAEWLESAHREKVRGCRTLGVLLFLAEYPPGKSVEWWAVQRFFTCTPSMAASELRMLEDDGLVVLGGVRGEQGVMREITHVQITDVGREAIGRFEALVSAQRISAEKIEGGERS